MRIEDYALIGDCQTAALVSLEGSIDWLCLPRFDSEACFAALLGTKDNGRWQICPATPVTRVSRRYRGDTLILDTDFETESGAVRLTDFMPVRSDWPDVVRIVRGIRGRVKMRMQLIIRFDYGSVVPWVRHIPRGITAVAGPDCIALRSNVPMHGEDLTTVAEFEVAEGQEVTFDYCWYASHTEAPGELDIPRTLHATESWWTDWAKQCTYKGEYRAAVIRSLITLKALTYLPTGGMVAAPTTSLPESLGGVRNWDYRYCWLRDATFTLLALLNAGYREEAQAWRQWLLRAVAGDSSRLQIMYGIRGERRLFEHVLRWLPGYEHSAPVRIGNGAYDQFQLDVYGEVSDMLHQCRVSGMEESDNAWRLERAIIEHLETVCHLPDEGIWEVRGGRRHFTHSKMMAWVALDRAIKSIEQFRLEGPAERWRALRDHLHREVCQHGFNASLGSFTQFFGGDQTDASLLMMPLVGFLPITDPRVAGTITAIERELIRADGFVCRYVPREQVDGLPEDEATFLPCSFWLADCYAMQERHAEAHALFRKLLAIRNDVGLLAEEYDVSHRRLAGNFPQAFSHIGLVNTANILEPQKKQAIDPAKRAAS
jgi:GH15 family glucan-1,4-alpha-glucosidase